MGRTDFSDQFRKSNNTFKRIDNKLNVMRLSLCLVINSITVDNFATLNCTPVYSMMAPTKSYSFSWLGLELYCLLLGPPGLNL